jgi:repressor LexA
MLTKKQKNLLIYINEKLKKDGISPSYDEMRMSSKFKVKIWNSQTNISFGRKRVL